MTTAAFRIWRGDRSGGAFCDYSAEVTPGMVVLDAVIADPGEQANDLAVRWNCKAGKCGSCSAEINGMPKLMCMTRLSGLPLVSPSWSNLCAHFRQSRIWSLTYPGTSSEETHQEIQPRPPDAPDGTWRMAQEDVDRVQEFRKCIECFLCQDVCHVLRNHHLHDEFIRSTLSSYTAALWRCILWTTRIALRNLRETQGIGYCNITKCCTKVCPEGIQITDNAIIPLKERVVDEFYDPDEALF